MFIHNVKTGLRHMSRNWTGTMINQVSLGLGIACCLIIFLYVNHELNYDKYIPDPERIYRAYFAFPNHGGNNPSFPHLSYPSLCEGIPDIENHTLTYPYGVQVVHGTNVFKESQFLYTDSSLFKIFNWKIRKGNSQQLLSEPFDIVISEKMARKYLGDVDPIGKTLKLDNRVDYTICAVMEDIPEQSHLQGDFFVNISSCPLLHPQYNSWIVRGSYIYIKLKPNSNKTEVENKLTMKWHEITNDQSQANQQTSIKLQPLAEIYLNANEIGGPSQFSFGSYSSIMLFSIIGMLILLIACFNYLNLTFAKIYVRLIETGIRKTNGADKFRIIGLFVTESSINVLISLSLGYMFASLMLPSVNLIIGKNLYFLSCWFTVLQFLGILFFLIVAGTSLYPALVMASLNPVEILNGRLYNISRKNKIRDWFITRTGAALITFQFIIVIIICICTLVIVKQIRYMSNVGLGFEKDRVIVLKNPWDKDQKTRYDIMSRLAAEIPGIEMVSGGYDVPVQGTQNFCGMYDVNDPENVIGSGMASVDYEYLKLLGVKFVAGRNFSPEYQTDSLAVIITENAVTRLGLKEPLNTEISGLWDNRRRPVIGIVNDMTFNDSYSGKFPMVFECRQMRRPYSNKIILKLKSADYKTITDQLHTIWKKEFPDMAFTSFTFDEIMHKNYVREIRLQQLMYIFTGLSFTLCLMGLIGVVTVYIRRRTKEIGIRRANGSKMLEVIALFNKDFVIYVIVAFFIATPVAWYFSNRWLQTFSIQTTLSLWIFAAGGMITLFLAIITVSLQIFKTASMNPVEALHYE